MLFRSELVTIPVEMAPRLATYMVMRENGHSAIDSADYSGAITVDFNMRGASEWSRALYLFFNPAIQGTAGMYKLMKLYPRRFALASTALFSIGFLTSMLTRLNGDDDDEETKARRKAGIELPPWHQDAETIGANDPQPVQTRRLLSGLCE